MLRRIDNNKMGSSDLGWLKSKFHFSFAEYYNPSNINFGVLRVINDDLVKPGTGVFHSEHNLGEETLRFLQIWIYPDKNGYEPNYGDYKFEWNDRKNKWLNIVSSKEGNAPIKVNQDANTFVLELDKDQEIEFKVGEGRQAYLVQIEGRTDINNIGLNMRDGLEIIEEDIKIKAIETSHFLLIEMKKE